MNGTSSNIILHFIDIASKFPEKNAILVGKSHIRYGELLLKVQHKAAELKKASVVEGTHILLLVPMSIDMYVNLLAIFYIGAVAIIIDKPSDKQFATACQKKAECKAVVISPKARLLFLINKAFRGIEIKIRPKTKIGETVSAPTDLTGESPALITFTTGSTGEPKAALRSHTFLYEQYQALSSIIEPRASDIDFVTLPIVLLMNLGVGATSLIPGKTLDKLTPKDFYRLSTELKSKKINRITCSPFFLQEFNKMETPIDTFENIKRIFTGGGPVFPSDAKQILLKLNPETFKVIYGSTEAEPISCIYGKKLAETNLKEGLPVGTIHDNIVVKIIEISSKPLNTFEELTSGQIGEIIVSGSHVLDTYYKSEEAFRNNKIVVDKTIWHRTGDAGFIDNKGDLFLCGRANRIIQIGKNIYSPFILENALSQIVGINRGTAIKIKDSLITLFIEADNTESTDSIEKQIENLSLPKHEIMYVKNIPMDGRHRTKIDYSSLLNMSKGLTIF